MTETTPEQAGASATPAPKHRTLAEILAGPRMTLVLDACFLGDIDRSTNPEDHPGSTPPLTHDEADAASEALLNRVADGRLEVLVGGELLEELCGMVDRKRAAYIRQASLVRGLTRDKVLKEEPARIKLEASKDARLSIEELFEPPEVCSRVWEWMQQADSAAECARKVEERNKELAQKWQGMRREFRERVAEEAKKRRSRGEKLDPEGDVDKVLLDWKGFMKKHYHFDQEFGAATDALPTLWNKMAFLLGQMILAHGRELRAQLKKTYEQDLGMFYDATHYGAGAYADLLVTNDDQVLVVANALNQNRPRVVSTREFVDVLLYS